MTDIFKEGDVLKEDIKGFLMLCVLYLAIPIVATTIPKIRNLIIDYQNYSGALIILIRGFIFLIFGSMAYGILKKEIKNYLRRDKYDI